MTAMKWNDVRPGAYVWWNEELHLVQRVQFTSMDSPGVEMFVTLSNRSADMPVNAGDLIEVVPPPPSTTLVWEPGNGQWVVLVDTTAMQVPEVLRIEIDGGVLWDNENHPAGERRP